MAPAARPWTTRETTYLRQHHQQGARAIALALDRSIASVKRKAHELGISLRTPGTRTGLLLGQPRNVSWKTQTQTIPAERLERIRQETLDGELDLAELYARIREDATGGKHQPLCPQCMNRHQENNTTGLCTVCHYRALAQAHRDRDTLADARRELWRVRQERSRETRRKDSDTS